MENKGIVFATISLILISGIMIDFSLKLLAIQLIWAIFATILLIKLNNTKQ